MKTASIFTSHMIFQRGKDIHIWGVGEENEKVSVTLQYSESGQPVVIPSSCSVQTAVQDGCWHIILPPLDVCRNVVCIICGESETITLEDISIGDVYLAGGQSNMEFWMRYDADLAAERNICANQDIRFYDCPEICYEGQEQDFDYSKMGFWRTCDPENIEYFSAVGYYFAKEIQRSQQIPVGIIGCNWGGSTASAWMDEEHLSKHGQIWLDEYQEGLKNIPEDYVENFRKNPMNDRGNPFENAFGETMLFGLSHEEQLKFMKENPSDDSINLIGPCHQNRPGGLYEFMLKKTAPFPVSGVLWYQGESDETHAAIYKDVLSDMIDCWRELWHDTLPFFCVQLAPFDVWLECTGDNFPVIRQQQYDLSREKEGVFLISSSDGGMRYDIHPKKKQPIGYRLALCARSYIYGEDISWDAPVMDSVVLKDRTLLLHFAHAYEGLSMQGSLQALQIFGITPEGKRTEIPADSCQYMAGGEQITVILPDAVLFAELEIAFAYTPYYEVNLYNSAGIPAIPSRIVMKTM
ncbi:MAG: sialate O-acetylesterase [Lachnospiraceae bacterium]|nr:sialate O-acetylesterase [Lachnospiraceae bacterium]